MNNDNYSQNSQNSQNRSGDIVFSGTISVKAVLEARPADCHKLYINKDKRSRDLAYIISLAKRNGVPVELLSKTQMNEQFEKAGGAALEARPRTIKNLQECPGFTGLAVYLAGVEDPHNLGSCVRSLYASGTAMVVLLQRDWSNAAQILLRASAGAWEKMPVYMIENEEELLEFKNRQNVPMFCASRKDPVSLFDYEFPQTCLGVIGGALRGISPALENACDSRVCIPYGRDFRNALDTPAAAAVFGFAWLREHPEGLMD